MPDSARLLNTLRQAVQLYRASPGRRGRLVCLDGAADVFVAGDLHGNLDHFRRILTLADLARNPSRHLVLQELIHGPWTYPGGGDRSHQLFDLAAALKCQFPRQVHVLPGNHELAQWTDRPIFKGDASLNQLFDEGVREAYGDRADEVDRTYRVLFAALPLALRTTNRVFLTHSLPAANRRDDFDPAVLELDETPEKELLPGGGVFALVWGRDVSEDNAADFLSRVDADLLVTGHIPCDGGFEAPNSRQLILDAQKPPGAYCLFPCDRPLTHAELLGCVREV